MPGLQLWLDKQKSIVEYVRSINDQQSDEIRYLWEADGHGISEPGGTDDIVDPCNGPREWFEYGPLLDTRWGQGCIYNAECPTGINSIYFPTLPCDDDIRCGHTPTGCVATTMLQIMNYYESPSPNSWHLLQERYRFIEGFVDDFNLLGADEIASMMREVGESVDMNYGCSDSGATTADIADALEADYGYANGGSYEDYSYPKLAYDIRLGKPVVLRAESNGEGHAWVCDGYKGYNSCFGGFSYEHMNWGWNGSWNDWYSTWNPSDNNFDTDRKMIVNITP